MPGFTPGIFNEVDIILAEVLMPIESGIPAPDFELLDDTGDTKKLSDFRGQRVVLYFYPNAEFRMYRTNWMRPSP